MQNKQVLLCSVVFILSLTGCQKSSETNPAPTTRPIWMMDSYSEKRGFTFTENMMVEYVATCLEPNKIHTATDATDHIVFDSGSPCLDLIPLVGRFDQLSVTTSGTDLTLAANGREYHFKIRAVRSNLSKNDCADQEQDESDDGNE